MTVVIVHLVGRDLIALWLWQYRSCRRVLLSLEDTSPTSIVLTLTFLESENFGSLEAPTSMAS